MARSLTSIVFLGLVLFQGILSSSHGQPLTSDEKSTGLAELSHQLVYIKRHVGYGCTGIIIDPNFILTPASCALNMDVYNDFPHPYEDPKEFQVVAGSSNNAHQVRNVSKIIMDKDYNNRNWIDGLSIWKIESPFEFDDHMKVKNIFFGKFAVDENKGLMVALLLPKEKMENGLVITQLSKQLIDQTDCRNHELNFKKQNVQFYSDKCICAYSRSNKTLSLASVRQGAPVIVNGSIKGLMSFPGDNFNDGFNLYKLPQVYIKLDINRNWISNTINKERAADILAYDSSK